MWCIVASFSITVCPGDFAAVDLYMQHLQVTRECMYVQGCRAGMRRQVWEEVFALSLLKGIKHHPVYFLTASPPTYMPCKAQHA